MKVPAGQQGPVGPPGPPGAPGNPGQNGISGLEIVYESSAMDSDTEKIVTASCPAGKKVVAGGGYAFNLTYPAEVAIVASFPVNGTSRRVITHETDAYAPG